MTAAAGALAMFTVHLEQRYESPLTGILWFIYTGGPDGAREILSTIAGSMITIAGVSFSIVIVALSLASNQFGHHLLRNFMRDRMNQVVLGTFIATFVYCLLVLRSIRSVDDDEFVPHLAVTLGLGFALLSLAVLIYFIHHVSGSIQSDHVIKVVAGELDRSIDRMFPGELGSGIEIEASKLSGQPSGWELRPQHSGYLQAIDDQELMGLAEKHELRVDLLVRPGSFLTPGITFATVSPQAAWTEKLDKSLIECFTIGGARTTQQDVEFAFEQLIEVAVRALSPGINAPFTAAACLDRLLQAFSSVIGREFPSPYRLSHDGVLRITAPSTDFRSLCDQAFDPIRNYGSNSVVVLLKMMEVLGLLVDRCPRSDRRQALLDHAAETRRVAEKNLDAESHGLRSLTQKYDEIIKGNCEDHKY